MGKSVILEIEGVGPVLFENSSRARHINISVKPFKGVRVAVPHGLTFVKAEEFVREKVGWMKKHLIRMKAEERVHEALLDAAVEVDRRAARKRLVERLGVLSEKYGLIYNRVFVRNQKTLWGSCSGKNNISLNIQLVQLPEELIDYVITHELVHTRIKNHGKAFWGELNRLVPGARVVDAKLKKYRLLLG